MKRDLWYRLADYDFNDLVPPQLFHKVSEMFGGRRASIKAFAAKIARKHGWSEAFALRAVEEYKKFVYLGLTSKYVVSPPRVIDIVWHEHILFTLGYRKFCDSTLREVFDHHPELVPFQDQTGVFNAQYLKILDFYRFEFNAEPPADIWGKPKFDEKSAERGHRPHRKADFDEREQSVDADTPLHILVDSVSSSSSDHGTLFGGGKSGGAGAESGWGISDNSPAGGDGGSDAGGCSSGCGGGGCGGD